MGISSKWNCARGGVGFLFPASQAAVDLRPVLESGSQKGGFASNEPAGPSTPKYGSWAGALHAELCRFALRARSCDYIPHNQAP